MLAGRKVAVLIAAVLLVGGGAVWLWLHFQPRPDPGPVDLDPARPPAPKWDDSAGGFVNAGVYLLPLGPKDLPRRPGPEVWKALLPGMAGDAATKALLRRLYNDLPVAFVVLPGAAAKDESVLERTKGPPGAAVAVVVRVAGSMLEDAGNGDGFGSLGCRRDMRVAVGAKSANFVKKEGNVTSSRGPNDFAVILFAMNDYLLRTGAGYGAFDGGPFTPQSIREKYPTQDLKALRADLDRRMAAYLKEYGEAGK